MSRCQWCAKPLVDDMEVVDRECSDCWVKHALRDEMETPMDERAQEQGGAVQSAEEFYQRLDECWGFADQTEDEVAISQVLAIKQRDAAIRRAAIEECDAQISQLKELLLDRQSSPE